MTVVHQMHAKKIRIHLLTPKEKSVRPVAIGGRDSFQAPAGVARSTFQRHVLPFPDTAPVLLAHSRKALA